MNKIIDFIIAGAPKCGTTALWYFLNEHPQVFMSKNKEPKFFTKVKGSMEKGVQGSGPRLSGNYEKGFEWYSALFASAAKDQYKGEASTIYFCCEDAPCLIKESNPEVKLIFMLRDPVKRLYSHYWQEYKLGFNFPAFEEMLQQSHPRFEFYKQVSSYKQHLQRYLQHFHKEQLLIIIQEEFEKDPEHHFLEVQKFLGLQNHEVLLNKRLNEQRAPKNRNLAKVLTLLQAASIKKLLPIKIQTQLGQVRRQLFKLNSKPYKYPPLSEEYYTTMSKDFRDDVAFVENWLGHPIESWRRMEAQQV